MRAETCVPLRPRAAPSPAPASHVSASQAALGSECARGENFNPSAPLLPAPPTVQFPGLNVASFSLGVVAALT